MKTAKGLYVNEVCRGTEADPLVLEPNVVRCDDKSLVMTWTAGGVREPAEENKTYVAKSYDNGRTWVDKRVLFTYPGKGVFTPELFNDNGKLLAFPGTYTSMTTYCQNYNAFLSVSKDNGNSFSTPVFLPGCINHFLAKSCIRRGNKLIVACSYIELDGENWMPDPKLTAPEWWDWGRNNHSEYCGVLIKEDDKDTWRLQGHLGYKGGHFTEPFLVEFSDGTLVMLIRLSYEHILYKSISSDGGETWSAVEKTDIPSAVSKTCLMKDSHGRIYMLFNPGPTRRRTPLSLWVSDDDMKTWSIRKDILCATEPDEIMTYPDGFIDEDRQLLCFAWENRRQIYYSELALESVFSDSTGC